jgi:hypothetical protein
VLPWNTTAATKTWNSGAGTSNWDTDENWNPIGVPGTTDQAIINNGNTVTKATSLVLNDTTATTSDGLELQNGTLNITGSFTSTTAGGANSGLTSVVGTTSTDATLTISSTLTLGNTNTTSGSSSVLSIFAGSSVTAGAFQGQHGSSTTAGVGGYTINVTGGTFDVTGAFDWSNTSDLDPTGSIRIGSVATPVGGAVTIGTMNADWDDRANQFVLFNDSLGELTFGKTNYPTVSNVEALIAGSFIRKDASITSPFTITDNGATWTVTVPEPGLASGLVCIGLMLGRRRRR